MGTSTQKVSMSQLYQRAIMDSPRVMVLGSYNRQLGHGHVFTPAEIAFFAQHGVNVAGAGKKKHGDGLLISIIQNPQVKAAFEDYARDCAAEDRKPFLTDKIAAHVGRLTSMRRNIEPEMICGIAMLRNRLRIGNELLDHNGFVASRVGEETLERNKFWSSDEYELLKSCREYGQQVLQIEGEGMTLFYTFAPYVHEVLTLTHGLSQSDSIMLVASWPFRLKRKLQSYHRIDGNYLLGIEDLYRAYYLGDNPAGPSHEFTRLKAGEVAEVLLREKDDFTLPSFPF
jgi:hypothetical protein